jgi:hypothetical protein
MTPKISWTPAERDLINNLVIKDFTQDTKVASSIAIFHSICKAQTALPVARQRPIKGPSNFPGLIAQLRQMIEHHRAEPHPKMSEVSTPAIAPAVSTAPTITPPAPATLNHTAPATSFSQIFGQLFDLALDKVAERVAAKIALPIPPTAPPVDLQKVAEAVFNLFEQRGYLLTSTEPSSALKEAVHAHEEKPIAVLPEILPPKPSVPETSNVAGTEDWLNWEPIAQGTRVVEKEAPSKAPHVRIGVLGLFDHQHGIIANKFPDIDFKFYTRGYPKVAAQVDYMIGLIRFMRHKTAERAQQDFGNNYIRVNGSLTALERAISALLIVTNTGGTQHG